MARRRKKSRKKSTPARGASHHDVLRLAEAVAAEHGLSALNSQDASEILAHIGRVLANARAQPQMVYGHRTQERFRFVAAALGCRLVKDADDGAIHVRDSRKVTPPDFLVTPAVGEPFLVEVKNNHNDAWKRWSMRAKDLHALQRYAALASQDLYIAIYWSRIREWTLVPPEALSVDGSKLSIDFGTALMRNRMSQLIGDQTLGSSPPLVFRLVADPAKTRSLSPAGEASFTVRDVELLCRGRVIEDPFERKLATLLLFYSRWEAPEGPVAVVDGSVLTGIELSFRPEEEVEGQDFAMLGSVSGMISRRFDELTSDGDAVTRLRPRCDPDALAIEIPPGYQGKALPLWRFTVLPNDTGTVGAT